MRELSRSEVTCPSHLFIRCLFEALVSPGKETKGCHAVPYRTQNDVQNDNSWQHSLCRTATTQTFLVIVGGACVCVHVCVPACETDRHSQSGLNGHTKRHKDKISPFDAQALHQVRSVRLMSRAYKHRI